MAKKWNKSWNMCQQGESVFIFNPLSFQKLPAGFWLHCKFIITIFLSLYNTRLKYKSWKEQLVLKIAVFCTICFFFPDGYHLRRLLRDCWSTGTLCWSSSKFKEESVLSPKVMGAGKSKSNQYHFHNHESDDKQYHFHNHESDDKQYQWNSKEEQGSVS